MVFPKRSPGRPKLSPQGSEQISMRFPQSMLEDIEAIVAERGYIHERAAVIRELVAEGLIQRRFRQAMSLSRHK